MQSRSFSEKLMHSPMIVAVVEDVVVGQDDALGETSGAASILDVDGVVEGEGFVPL